MQAENNNSCKVKVKLLPGARMPEQAHLIGDSGYDLFAHRIEDSGDVIKVFTGVFLQPEPGWYFELFPRSSITKKKLVMGNSVGVLDNSYTGQIVGVFYRCVFESQLEDMWLKFPYAPKPDEKSIIAVGEKILQLVLRKQFNAEFEQVEHLSETERGEGGFGSSNK